MIEKCHLVLSFGELHCQATYEFGSKFYLFIDSTTNDTQREALKDSTGNCFGTIELSVLVAQPNNVAREAK
jgi:hypothetical protein